MNPDRTRDRAGGVGAFDDGDASRTAGPPSKVPSGAFDDGDASLPGWTPTPIWRDADAEGAAVYQRAIRAGNRAYAVRRGQLWRSLAVWTVTLFVAAAALAVGRFAVVVWPETARSVELYTAHRDNPNTVHFGETARTIEWEGTAAGLMMDAGQVCADLTVNHVSGDAVEVRIDDVWFGPAGGALGDPGWLSAAAGESTLLLTGGAVTWSTCFAPADLPAGQYELRWEGSDKPLTWLLEIP